MILVGHAPGHARGWPTSWPSTAPAPNASELTQKYPTTGLAVLHHTAGWPDLAADDADLVSYVVPRG